MIFTLRERFYLWWGMREHRKRYGDGAWNDRLKGEKGYTDAPKTPWWYSTGVRAWKSAPQRACINCGFPVHPDQSACDMKCLSAYYRKRDTSLGIKKCDECASPVAPDSKHEQHWEYCSQSRANQERRQAEAAQWERDYSNYPEVLEFKEGTGRTVRTLVNR